MQYPLISVFILPALSHAFSLNTTTLYWNYTTSSLATTTSSKCKEAYSAEIDCDVYLVQLVNAGEQRYFLDSMEPDNFTQTCTPTCQSSLSKYIANVKASCTQPGDAAVKSLGFLGKDGEENVPVQTIGSLFQYTLMQSCAKDEDGQFCYIQQSSVLPADFDCDWVCALAYYWNNHQYPYSLWSVGDPSILDIDADTHRRVKVGNDMLFMGSAGDTSVDDGWKNIQKCGYGNSTTAPFDIGIKGVGTGILNASSTTAAAAQPTETESAGSKVVMTMQFVGLVVLSAFVLV
ncbi:hypothetical protein HFD88_008919 [Aspergillus terreus]|nr:hypothetical protein HFD88_008919 [Aspergillus terreus]